MVVKVVNIKRGKRKNVSWIKRLNPGVTGQRQVEGSLT